MAVIQISKIQVRRGLQENLPQLASGEFGWSVDTRKLYIGNGTLTEGAPTVGITEILTQYSGVSEAANIAILQGNVANLESNVSSLQSALGVSTITLTDNKPTATNTAVLLTSLHSNTLDYTIVRGTSSRVGTMRVTQLSGTAVYDDEYTQTGDTGVTLSWAGNATISLMTYTTTSTGSNATFTYYIKPYA